MDEGQHGEAQELSFDVVGEAYVIDVQLRFPGPSDSCLDFGTVPGVDEAKQSFSLVNSGQHGVLFRACIRKQVQVDARCFYCLVQVQLHPDIRLHLGIPYFLYGK